METTLKRNIQDILPEIRWDTIAPPYPDYDYFKGSDLYPFRYDAELFDPVNAWWLIEASTLAYSEPGFARERFVRAGLGEVEFFSGPSTQCYVANNDRFLIAAFRGTEIRPRKGTTNLRTIAADIRADFDILLKPWGQGGRVHSGFQKALDEVWETKRLEAHIRSKDDGRRTVWFTGHSLGAALATLAAHRYGEARGLYTFGSPRVGDEGFRQAFRVNTCRIVNNNDIVARVPPEGLYRHVGNPICIDDKGLLHDAPSRWEILAFRIRGKIAYTFNRIRQKRSGFASLLPVDIIDHVPTLYATHLWNNIL